LGHRIRGSRAGLGAGEREAIALALALQASRILLDDQPARRLAFSLGMPVVGTLGLLLAAKRRALLPTVRPTLDALVNAGFRAAPELYEQILRDAGEAELSQEG